MPLSAIAADEHVAHNTWVRHGYLGFLDMTRVEKVNRMSSGRIDHFEKMQQCSSSVDRTKDGRIVGLLGRGSWFCAIPNQCLRLLYSSKGASVVFLVTRRSSAAVYGLIIMVCHTKSHSITSDIAQRSKSFIMSHS